MGVRIKRLFIAEKHSVAQAIAEAIGGFSRSDGYYYNSSSQQAVTWCVGHMLQLCDPEDYDEKLARWDLDDLPIFFSKFQHKPNPTTKDMLVKIHGLLKIAESVVHAGDTDDEGQLVVDELLRFYNYQNPVFRVLINDNHIKSVKKALAAIEPNSKYENMGWKAQARALCDLLFGYNLTRAYTLRYGGAGKQGVVSVGRVQTPILGLVVRRDRLNETYSKYYYYRLLAKIEVGSSFIATFNGYTSELKAKIDRGYEGLTDLTVDDDGKFIDKKQLVYVGRYCQGKPAKIISFESKEQKKSAPLPFNLDKLQQEAYKKYGYGLGQVKQITQELREQFKLITYNRTDCRYLNEEHFESAPEVLDAIKENLEGGEVAQKASSADSSIKGRVFNNSKVSAHHAIIPSETITDISKLNKEQRNIYELIARFYIAQFYPSSVYLKQKVVVDIGGCLFTATASTKILDGWEVVFDKNDLSDEDEAANDEGISNKFEDIKEGSSGKCSGLKIDQKETSPPPLYTLDSLSKDVVRAAKYIKDPKLAKILIDRDKDKDSEHGSIGTAATRDSVIEGLFERGFLSYKGKTKKIISTDKGRSLYDMLDDIIKYPDMSAIWTERQKNIKSEDDVLVFAKQMMKEVVIPEVKKIKSNVVVYNCPKCGRKMLKHHGKKGVFWGCSGYRDEKNQCNHIMDDDNGKPIPQVVKKVNVKVTNHLCSKCKSKLGYLKGKKSYYFKCQNQDCGQIYFKEKKGRKPDYNNIPS